MNITAPAWDDRWRDEPITIDLPPTAGDRLRALIQPWSEAELEAAKKPWRHTFQDGHVGMFPEGEVTVIAAAGREGKTTIIVGVGTALVIGHTLGTLWPNGSKAIIYSLEDDRQQYARKVAAQCAGLSPANAAKVRQRLLVPDLDQLEPGLARALVMLLEGHAIESAAVDNLIEAIRPMMEGADAPCVLVFETASTLSDADETNPGFRVLVMALRRIARTLKVAVVLSHHVSQQSLSRLPDLDLSTADIRGATALVNNSRQTALLVNLGSADDPFPANDARTVLREMVASDMTDRITVLVTLDSSKGITPPPVFFRWVGTDWGPAAVELEPPPVLLRRSWRKVREMVMAERASLRQDAKVGRRDAAVSEVLQLVRKLEAGGRQPTVRAVSDAAGKSPGWAKPYLEAAVDNGELHAHAERVPRTKGETVVYRLPHPSEARP